MNWIEVVIAVVVIGFIIGGLSWGFSSIEDGRKLRNLCTLECETQQLYFDSVEDDNCWCRSARSKPIKIKSKP